MIKSQSTEVEEEYATLQKLATEDASKVNDEDLIR